MNSIKPQKREKLHLRFPARLQRLGQPLMIWLLGRVFDPKGSGSSKFSVEAAAAILNKGESTIYRYLKSARDLGLLRYYKVEQGWCHCYYSSLAKVAASIGLEDLGPIARIEISQLRYLKILATEIETQEMQRRSFIAAKAEFKLYKKQNYEDERRGKIKFPRLTDKLLIQTSDLIPPTPVEQLFTPPCDTVARVLGKNNRFLFVSEGFKRYGGSQDLIASLRNISTTTVGRHFQNNYRLTPTPNRLNFRCDTPVEKFQIAYRLPQGFVPLKGKHTPSGKFLKVGDRYFEPECNVYLPRYDLIPYKKGRQRYKQFCRTAASIL